MLRLTTTNIINFCRRLLCSIFVFFSFAEFTTADDGIIVGKRYELVGRISSAAEAQVFVETSSRFAPIGGGRIGIDYPDRRPPAGRGSPWLHVQALPVQELTESQQSTGSFDFFGQAHSFLTRIEPSLVTGLSYRKTNVENSSNGIDASDEVALIVAPSARFLAKRRKWSLDTHYLFEQMKYWRRREDTSTLHQLTSTFRLNVMGRSELSVKGRYVNANDQEAGREVLQRLPKYDLESFALDVGFRRGTRKDRVRFEGLVAAESVDYDGYSNIERISFDRLLMGGNAFYQFRPRIAFYLGLEEEGFKYRDSDLDSAHTRILIGNEILLRKRLSSNISMGLEKTRFDFSNDARFLPVWNANIMWKPRRSTMLTLDGYKKHVEPYRVWGVIALGEEAVEDRLDLSWSQLWSAKLSSRVGFGVFNSSFRSSELKQRVATLQLTHRVREWLSLSAVAEYNDRKYSIGTDVYWTSLLFKVEMRF